MAVATGGSAGYVGIDRVDARIHGLSGSFILVHSATRSSAGESAAIAVLADTASGDLEGLRGETTIAIASDGSHAYTFDYEL